MNSAAQLQLANAAVVARAASAATLATENGFGGAVCTKGWTVTRNVKPAYAHMGHDAGMYIPTQRPRGPM